MTTVGSRIRTRWTRAGDSPTATPHGPLGVAGQRKLLSDWLAKYPRPISLLISRVPEEYKRAAALGFDDDDINAACLLGATLAARKFDPRRGFKFWTYALPWMRQSVQRMCREPQREYEDRGREHLLDLDTPVGRGDDQAALHTTIPDRRAEAAPDLVQTADMRALVLAVARRQLAARDRQILVMRFGLDGGPPMTLNAVAERIGVTRERVRQIEVRAVRRITPLLRQAYQEMVGD